jgi:hypothetical protein
MFIPDPGLTRSRIRIRIKEFKYFNSKNPNKFPKIRFGMFIPDPGSELFPIPDPGLKQTGSAALVQSRAK